MHVLVDNCTFSKNYGLNVGFGSAMSIYGFSSEYNFKEHKRLKKIFDLVDIFKVKD